MNHLTAHARFATATLLLIACSSEPSDPAPVGSTTLAAKASMSTPTLSQTDASATTITIEVCAGATGAPAGFSVQWLEAEDLAAYGGVWPEYTELGEFCKASFSGNAATSRFDLAPYECTDVEIGNLFDEEPGVSFTCNDDLLCGTEYAFRAFAHADSTLKRSEFTPTYFASTIACEEEDGCTLTQGYWKNHFDSPGWPVTDLAVGTVVYSTTDLLAIFNQPAQGNGLIALAHQLIAAKLNIESGANPTDALAAIAAADALIGSLVVPPIGTGYLAPSTTSALTTTLANYNEGATGPGHCE